MPRFVLLKHTMPDGSPRATHWDFMLEHSGVLRTWALEAEPRSSAAISAIQLADHRAMYLDYEGPVSEGRGTVKRCDLGEYILTGESASDDVIELELHGEWLIGRVTLNRQSEDPQRWRFVFVAEAALGGDESPS